MPILDDMEAEFNPIVVTAKPVPKDETRLERLDREATSAGARNQNYADELLSTIETSADIIQKQRAARVEAARAAAEQTKQITARSHEATSAAYDKVLEGLETRDAIETQTAEVKAANPFVRAVKSILNPEWHLGKLRKEKGIAEERVKEGVQDAQAVTTTTNMRLGLQAADQQADGEVRAAITDEAAGHISIANDMLAAGKAELQTIQDQIQTDGQVAQVTEYLTDKAVSNLDDSLVPSLLEAAKSQGSVIIEGVRVPTAKLQQRQAQLAERSRIQTQQQLSIQSQRIGIQNQSLAQEAMLEQKFIGTLSLTETQAAIAAGGVFGGRQLDLGQLGQHLKGVTTALVDSADVSSMSYTARGATGAVLELMEAGGGIADRIKNAWGNNVPTPLVQATQAYAMTSSRVRDMLAYQRKNPNDPRGDAMLLTAQQQQVEAYQQYTSRVEASVKLTGGTAAEQALLTSKLMGSPVNPSVASVAFAGWAATGQIPSWAATAQAQAALPVVASRLAALKKSPEYATALKENKAQMESAVVFQTLQSMAGKTMSNQFILGLPARSAAAGKPLPISEDDFAREWQMAQSRVSQNIAAQYGVKPEDIQSLNWKTLESKLAADKKNPIRSANELAAVVTKQEMNLFLAQLKTRNGALPAQVVASMNNPVVQQAMTASIAGQLRQEPIVSGISAGQLALIPKQGAAMFTQAAEENERDERLKIYEQERKWRGNVIKEFQVATQMLPDVSPAAAKRFSAYLTATYGETHGGTTTAAKVLGGLSETGLPGLLTLPARAASENTLEIKRESILKDLGTKKMDDPELEVVRKAFIKNYESQRPLLTRAINAFMED